MFSSSPELLSLLPFVETLEDNEAITAGGLNCYSIIHEREKGAAAATKVLLFLLLLFSLRFIFFFSLWGF